MTRQAQVDPGGRSAEDDLRLPRPPGVIRGFWARHPRAADIILVIISLVLGLPSLVLVGYEEDLSYPVAVTGWVMMSITSLALLWRRRRPVIVFAVTFSPIVLLDPAIASATAGIAAPIALYSVAVHRSSQAALWSLGAATLLCTGVTIGWMLIGPTTGGDALSLIVGTTTMLLIGTLIGTNVGSRKRYVDALIERSRQLAIERDQQAKLAASAERTRIAREMHDIVSHSLAVVVTLAEGAHATDDPARSKQANRAIADTARDALSQMRVMLGVLRAEDANGSAPEAAESREPLLDLSPEDVVDNARAAGVPVTLTTVGRPVVDELQRLAVLRVVQEGLTNAMRYGQDASFVRVDIDYAGDTVEVRVENDGGADAEPSLGAGVGLQGLQERVTALGGEFEAGPASGAGWVLRARFPKEQR